MIQCQRLHQVGSTEDSLGLIPFIENELDDRRDCGAIKLHIVCSRKGLMFQNRKNRMQIKQSNCYIIQ